MFEATSNLRWRAFRYALIALARAGIVLSSSTDDEGDPLSATGRWEARQRFESAGIIPHAFLTTEAWGNVAGGPRQGAWWDQLLDFGIELDSEKLAGFSGGRFVAQLHWAANSQRDSNFADNTGAFNPVSGIMASDHLRVFNLYYQQTWGNDLALLKIGQLAADDDFMTSSYTGLFANAALGAMPSQVGNRLASCCGFSPPFPMLSSGFTRSLPFFPVSRIVLHASRSVRRPAR